MASRKNRKSGKQTKGRAKLTGKQARLRRANQLVNRAWEAEDQGDQEEAIQLARKAIELSKECSGAWMLLGYVAPTVGESLAHFEQAVAAANRHLGQKALATLAAGEAHIDDKHPWFLAHVALGRSLFDIGRTDDGLHLFVRLLQVCPDEGMGVRWRLAEELLDMGYDNELYELLTRYPRDESAFWCYTRALFTFRREGDSPAARKALDKARSHNPFVPKHLVAQKELPLEDLPEYSHPGTDAEAILYVQDNLEYWQQTPEAIPWVRKVLDGLIDFGDPDSGLRRARKGLWKELMPAVAELPLSDTPEWAIDLVRKKLSDEDAGIVWVVVIAGATSGLHIGMKTFFERPSNPEVFEVLLKTLVDPSNGKVGRPAVLHMKRKGFFQAWQKRLDDVGIRCELADELPGIDYLLDVLDKGWQQRQQARQGDFSDDQLRELSLEQGAVWRATVRQLPAWLHIEEEIVQPWVRMVVDLGNLTVLETQITNARPPEDWLREGLAMAMLSPGIGQPRRPGMVRVDSERQVSRLQTWLESLEVDCGIADDPDPIESILADFTEQMTGPGRAPSLVSTTGMKTDLIAALCDAAWSFYMSEPWMRIPGDAILKIECDAWESGPWYANVMGQLGMELGLALYEDLRLLQRMVAGQISDEELARQMSSLALSYSERFDMAPDDVKAIEEHGWPVADDQAWPNVIRVNRGMSRRAALPWEVELLVACLRAIPTTLTRKGVRTGWGEVQTAGRAVRIQVSLVKPG
ncbi:hypothetical protein [Maioricimonas sp. JC845]|uniref:DUF7309 domain-containing protein n=1 Tax=Maioricimonas sp. JC845 TaxID=3232138 RepID=UPI0034598152